MTDTKWQESSFNATDVAADRAKLRDEWETGVNQGDINTEGIDDETLAYLALPVTTCPLLGKR